MSKKIFLLVALLVAGMLLLPTQLNIAYAAPGVDGAVWFYPQYDVIPVYPDVGENTLQLWVSPVAWSSTGIREVEIWVPKDIDGLALYRVREVHVALFYIDGLGTEMWVLDPVNWTVSLTNIDSNGNPTLIIASALSDGDALYNSSTTYPYFRAAVFELIVEYYRGDIGADGLAHNVWSVTLSGTDLSSKNFLVDHYVDNQAPEVAMSSSTASLFSDGLLNTLNFNFTVSITDNSGLTGYNFSVWGFEYPSLFIGPPTGDVADVLGYIWWDLDISLKNAYTAPVFDPIAPFDGTLLPESTTYGETGYLWGVLVIIASDAMGNYTQIYPLVSYLGTNTFMAYDSYAGQFGVNLSLAAPNWLGGLSPTIEEFTAKFCVIAFDGTADYHWDSDIWLSANYWGAIVNTSVTPIFNNTAIECLTEVFVDAFVHDITDVELNGVPHVLGYFGSFATGEFTLTWNWTYPNYGPDPTFEYFRIVIYHETSNQLLLDTTTTDFFLDFTVETTGIGDYNVTIFVKDSYAEENKFTGYFTVTEFVLVWLNGEFSKWGDYPDWVVVPQMGSVVVDIKTFGRPFDMPLQAVNVTVTEQYVSGGSPYTWTVIYNEWATVTGGTSTYGTWQFTIDVDADLNNNVSIFNVTVVWYNTSTSSVIASNGMNTFMVKRVLFMDIWTDTSDYDTGETVTFFAHLYDIDGNGLDAIPVSVTVMDPTGFLIATTAGYTVDGYVIPSVYGTIMFGTPIGDAWPTGVYTVDASAAVEDFIGMWFNGTMWVNVTTVTTLTDSTTFTVSSLRDRDIMAAIMALASTLDSVSAALDNVMASLSDLSTTLGNVDANVQTLLSNVADLAAAVSDLRAVLDGVASDVTSIVSTLGDLESALSSLNANIQDLMSTLASVNDKLDSVLSSLNNLATKGDVNNVASSLSTMSSDLSSALGSLSSLLTATAVLVIITLIVAAVATFKVFKG